MALVYAQNVIEIAMVGRIGANIPHVNVLHYRSEEGINAGDAAAVQDVVDNWQDHILDFLTSTYTFVEAQWRSLDPDDSNVGTIPANTAKPVAGANTGTAFPPNVAYLVKKNTTNRPRGARDGRMFLSAVPEGAADNLGVVASANLTAANAALLAFYNGVTDNPVGSDVNRHLVVLETTPASRAPGATPVTVNARRVTSLTLDPMVSTQRDRLR